MFDDFEDPFGAPLEPLDLAPPPAASVRPRGPAYSDEEVAKLAAFGEGGDLIQDARYALRVRNRSIVLLGAFGRRKERVSAAEKVRNDELRELARKLPAVDDDDEGATRMDAIEKGIGIVKDRVERLRGQVKAQQEFVEPLRLGEVELREQTEGTRSAFEAADAAFRKVDDAINQAVGDPAARAPFEGEHSARGAERTTLRQKLERYERELSEARHALAEAMKRLQSLEEELDSVKMEERRLVKELEALTAAESDLADSKVRQRAADALASGKAGAILAAPCLDAYQRVRTATREAALHAAALNSIDDGSYRRGAELLALSVAFVVVTFGVLALL